MRISNISCNTDTDRNIPIQNITLDIPIQNITLDISILLEMSEEEILRDVFNDLEDNNAFLNALLKKWKQENILIKNL